jgi:hypothetical protein
MNKITRPLALLLITCVVIASFPVSQAKAVGPIIYIDNLQPTWTAPGGGGVWSQYLGPDESSTPVSPGVTALIEGREAGVIKAGQALGVYWDEGLFAFKPEMTINELAVGPFEFDVITTAGVNPVWMTIEVDTGITGVRADNVTYQYVPTTNPAGWHTVDGTTGLWQQWADNEGAVTGPLLTLGEVAAANDGLNVVRAYLRLGMGNTYYNGGTGTTAWVDKVTIGSVTYDFVLAEYWYVSPDGDDANNGTFASPFATIQHAVDVAAEGDTINVLPGTYTDGITIDTPHLTVLLMNGAVIQNNSPCFIVNASYTTIMAENIGGAKCVPTNGSNGIDVADGRINIIIDGLEIDGAGQTTGAGIDFAGAVTDVQIIDNLIHNLGGSGLVFGGAVNGTVDVQGNLITSVTAPAVVSSVTLNAAYNSWGAQTGAGTITNVTTVPFTHVELFLTSSGTPWADQVLSGEDITYTVSADLVNITGADFTLKYDVDRLDYVSHNDEESPFDPLILDDGGAEAELISIDEAKGEIRFTGWKSAPVNGTGTTLFSVTFTAITAGSSSLYIDPATDVFAMSPAAGPSNNVYAFALDSVTVLTLDPLSLTDLDLYESVDGSSWTQVPGQFDSGFTMLIDPANDYEYLDTDNIIVNRPLAPGLHPFYLDASETPDGFLAYWAGKGVVESAAEGTWQAIMWDIINGEQPIFYLKVVNTEHGPTYDLIDGLLYLAGQGEQTLRINGGYPLGQYLFTGTVTDDYGVSDSVDVSITFVDPLIVTNLKLTESIDQVVWTEVFGSLAGGYIMGLDPMISYEYLDVSEVISNRPLFDGLYPFYLETSALPDGFWEYWSGKGVVAGATGWQGVMWQIINGDQPMFYLKVSNDGAAFDLVDGLQYLVTGMEYPVRVNGNYPIGTYQFTGTVADLYGVTSTLTVPITFTNLYTVTGSFMIEFLTSEYGFYTFNAYYTGIPVTLTRIGSPGFGPHNSITTMPEGENITFTNVMDGTYVITTNMPRVLDIHAAMNKIINPKDDRIISPLTLIRGDADDDNIIFIMDAVLVGNQYGMTGNLNGDVNFDGRVSIGDLAIVGNHYRTSSEDYYGTWEP